MRVGVSGGLEIAFGGEREFDIPFAAEQVLVTDVIDEMAKRIKANGGDEDIFLQDGLVRPGILVLINDADWELLDKEDSVISNADNMHFSSTLHGG